MGQDKETTKDCIFTALTLLMEQKEYKYITVTDIARKSGVSRMTYYRTYSSKEDILIQHFRKIAQRIVDDANGDITQALCGFYTYFQEQNRLAVLFEQADLLQLLIESFQTFTDFLFHTIHSEIASDLKAEYTSNYETGGLFALLGHWFKNNRQESPEEMAQITLSVMMKQAEAQPVS